MPKLETFDVRFFSGQSHPQLATDIAAYLDLPLSPTHYDRFSNDNMYVQLGESVRGRSIYIVQSLTPPVSDHLVELLMMLNIAHTAGAAQVHAVIPYFSYSRSDKKDAPRIAITARLIADLLQTAGATHVMTMTLHSPQVHGFFSLPTDLLTARHLFVRYFCMRSYPSSETIVVSPDMGRAKPAARFADLLGMPVTAAQKERLSDDQVSIDSSIERLVKGYRRALIYDDEIATGATVLELSKTLVEFGIQEVSLICTHGVFSGDALARLSALPYITEIVTTNTVFIPESKRTPKLIQLSVAPVFGEAIYRNFNRQSIGDLFPYSDDEQPEVMDQGED
jgi:ribose-phosphate pyrophosphokinase